MFTQDRVAASAGHFLDGLLGPERRKTGWMRAEAAGDPGPWRPQARPSLAVVAGTAEAIAQGLEPTAWQRLSAGDGTKGPRLYDWSYLELAELKEGEYRDGATGVWTRGLPIRRNLADSEYAYFTTRCPAGTAIETPVMAEGQRWVIENAFETTRSEPGLDHNETRSWHGWHRHVSLVMLAFAMLSAIRCRANASPPKNADQPDVEVPDLIRWSVQEIRRVAIRLAQRIQPAYVIA